MTKHAAILCLAAAAASPAAADDQAPSSLRMRAPRPRTRWIPIQPDRRVAQLQPDPSPDDAPAPPPDDAPVVPPPDDAPAIPPPAPVPTPPTTSPPARLTDAERAKLTEEEGKTEVISVTDSTIDTSCSPAGRRSRS